MQTGNFLKSKKNPLLGTIFWMAKCPHQVIFPNLKIFLIHHFSNSTGNFSKSKKLPLWSICQNWKHVRMRKLFQIWQISPSILFFNSMHLPHDENLNCFFLVLRCVVSFASICHNIPTDVFNFTQVWWGRITEIQKQLEVTICSPCLEEIFAMLNQTDWICSFHSKMWYSFPVILYFWILYQLYPGCINLSKLWLSAIMRPACSWCTKFSWFQTIPVTLVHHTVLGQLCYVLHFITTCTESSCQRRWQVIWAII